MKEMRKPICSGSILAEAGSGGWPCYRIPGLVATAAGTLLAYYETRLDGHDWHARNVGLHRSTDGGQTWSDRREMVAQAEERTINNPIMVAQSQGRVHLFWEEDYCRFFQQYSDDDGLSWTPPQERTSVLQAVRGVYAWTAFGLGPGHGIETTERRLLLPVWLCDGGGRAHRPSVVTTLASDDGGSTWRCGEILPLPTGQNRALVNPNESALAQSRDGRILINMRHESARHRRALAVSPDGTTRWSAPWLAEDLPDPICCAGMVRLQAWSDLPDCLVVSNCATEGPQRTSLTISISRDDGKSWQQTGVLAELAGYSDLAASPDGQWLYCFYEEGRCPDMGNIPARLVVTRMNRAWLGL